MNDFKDNISGPSSIGILTLIQNDELEWLYIYINALPKSHVISKLKERNPSNIFHCIDEILPYYSGQRFFNFKLKYFDKVVTAEEAYEYLLCSSN